MLAVLRQLEARTPRERPAAAPAATSESELSTATPSVNEAPVLEQGPGVHDFTLPTADGQQVTLSSYLGEQNVVIVFYRAWW